MSVFEILSEITHPPTSGLGPWLLGLAGGWACLLIGGFVLGRPHPTDGRRMPVWTRMGSSLLLVLAGWLSVVWQGAGPVAPYVWLIAVGMSLGFVGDLALASLLPLAQPVLTGMAAFGLGHGAYMGAMLWLAGRFAVVNPAVWPTLGSTWLVGLVIGTVGWYGMVFRGQNPGILHWVALPYALLLASTAGIAAGLALLVPSLTGLALGALLFLISDLILAANLFNQTTFPLIHDLIWLTYGPAQFLIVYSVGGIGG